MQLQPLWGAPLEFEWSALAVGPVFKTGLARIVLGGTDGRIHILAQQKEEQVLETKGGCVEHLVLFNLLRLNAVELICADVQGTVVIFSNGEILTRSTMAAPVSALTIDTDMANRSLIVAGDQEGTVSATHSHESAWSIRLVDFAAPRNAKPQGPYPVAVRCLQPITLKDAHGTPSHYLMAADGRPLLQFFNGGQRIFALETPSRVSTTCVGRFQSAEETVVAVGFDSGAVYLLEDFVLTKHLMLDTPVTQLVTCRTAHSSTVDSLACCTQSNVLQIFTKGECVLRHEFRDWIQAIAFGDIDGDREEELVVGLVNSSLHAFKVLSSNA